MRRAIALSGGGTKGAYEAGVWKALEELGVDYQIENFHVGISYDLGLKDINAFAKDHNDETGYTPIKNRTVLFTLGFDF